MSVIDGMYAVEFDFRHGRSALVFPNEHDYLVWLYTTIKNNPQLVEGSFRVSPMPSLPRDHDFGDLNKTKNLYARGDHFRMWDRYDQDTKRVNDLRAEFNTLMDEAEKGNFRWTRNLCSFLRFEPRVLDVCTPKEVERILLQLT